MPHFMKKTDKSFLIQLSLGTLLLLTVPISAIVFDWQWTAPSETPTYLYPLFLITETASVPFVLISCMLLSAVVFAYCRLPLKKSIILLAIMGGVILSGQGLKSAVKNTKKAPRPYVLWLQENHNLTTTEQFYAQSRQARARILAEQNLAPHAIPKWQQGHWQNETGYSFPSGHTIFVAAWALMILTLLWRKRAYLLISAVMLWALAIEASRLLLAMHWPGDIILSCLLAGVMVCIARYCWDKWVFATED